MSIGINSNLFEKAKTIRILETLIEEIRASGRASHQSNCDLTEWEQNQIPEDEQYMEFDAEMRLMMRPDSPSQALPLSTNDVKSHYYSEETGRLFDIYDEPFMGNGQLWIPLETHFPYYMVRKWVPNSESLARLKAEFGEDPTNWRDGEDLNFFDFAPIRLKVDNNNGTINAYAEGTFLMTKAEENAETPQFSS